MTHLPAAVVFALLVVLSCSIPPLTAQDVCALACQAAQRTSLLQLHGQTSPEGWNITYGWTENIVRSDGFPSHCSWHGIACCLDNRVDLRAFPSSEVVPCIASGGVSAILLVRNNLTGPIEQVDWSPLAQSLQYLDVSGNAITGSIPLSFSQLTGLTYLRLEHNRLTGTIPPPIFQMSNISTLIFTANLLSGSLLNFSALTNLAVFKAGDNRLTGAIPSDWTTSPLLQVFALEYNQMSGTIPQPAPVNLYGRYHTGMQIKLRNNTFYGSLPDGLKNLPIGLLDVGSNNISGNLSVIESMPLATEFRFDGNQLTGSIPTISPNVQVFDIQSNRLTGSVPAFRGTALVELRVSFNQYLEGPFPADAFVPYLLFFRIHATNLRQSDPAQQNSYHENLPPSLQFDRAGGYVSSQDVEQLDCYGVIANPKYFFNLKIVLVDSYYFDYQYCKCRSGYSFKRTGLRASCAPARQVNVGVLVPAVVFGFVALVLVSAASALFLRYKLLPAAAAHHKLKGPPGDGKPATLVLTDVEASTELWEWDRVTMMEAISIHDRIMRAHLSQYCGYEVSTEGDAFLVVFHDPADAVAYTVATQQALLSARWPFRLEEHLKSCLRMRNPVVMRGTDNFRAVRNHFTQQEDGAASGSEGSDEDEDRDEAWLSYGQVDPKDILHWGLNVRMAVATGVAEHTKVNAASKRREYHGKLKLLVEALSNVPHGGQIIVESSTFAGINTHLTDILKVVPAHPDYETMAKYRRESPTFVDALESEAAPLTPRHINSARNMQVMPGQNGGEDATSSLILALLGPSHRNDIQIVPGNHDGDDDALSNGSTSGHTTRTTAEIAALGSSSMPPFRSFNEDHFDSQQRLSMRHLLPNIKDNEHARQIRRWGYRRWRRVNARAVHTWHTCLTQLGLRQKHKTSRIAPGAGLIVVDMGTHVLPSIHGAHMLIQIAIPGLEERVRFTPPLRSIPISPGYLDAPGALDSPLVNETHERIPLEPVTLVFCSIDGLHAMKECNLNTAELALMMYQDYIRRWLLKMSGYECQQADGEFMLAFHSPVNAIQFCLAVQDAMLQGSWSREVLNLPNCGAAGGTNGDLLWYGPRIRMGMYEGEPTCIVPHTTSGRADYFGPLVNRAARFCYGAAHGGQIMMPLALAQRIVSECCGDSFELQDSLAEVPVFHMKPTEGSFGQDSVHNSQLSFGIQSVVGARRASDPRRAGLEAPADSRSSVHLVRLGDTADELGRFATHMPNPYRQQSITTETAISATQSAPIGILAPGALANPTATSSPNPQGEMGSEPALKLLQPRGLRLPPQSSRFMGPSNTRRGSVERARLPPGSLRANIPKPTSSSSISSMPAVQPTTGATTNTSLPNAEPLTNRGGSLDSKWPGSLDRKLSGSLDGRTSDTQDGNAAIVAKPMGTVKPADMHRCMRKLQSNKGRSRSAAAYVSSPIAETEGSLPPLAATLHGKGHRKVHRSRSYDLVSSSKSYFMLEEVNAQISALRTDARRSSAPIVIAGAHGPELDWASAIPPNVRNFSLPGADRSHLRGWRDHGSGMSTETSRRRMSRQSHTSDNSRMLELETHTMVEVHHCGLYHFKGLAELQNVVQMNASMLSGRQFPSQLPTKKGKLIAPARGLQCYLAIK